MMNLNEFSVTFTTHTFLSKLIVFLVGVIKYNDTIFDICIRWLSMGDFMKFYDISPLDYRSAFSQPKKMEKFLKFFRQIGFLMSGKKGHKNCNLHFLYQYWKINL